MLTNEVSTILLKWNSLNVVTRFTLISSVFMFLLFMIKPVMNDNSEDVNLYVYQSRAFLQGRLDISEVPSDTSTSEGVRDITRFGDKTYVSFPPFPAVLLMPFVGAFNHVNTTLISLLLMVISVFTFIDITKKLGLDDEGSIWLTMGLFLGSAYWVAIRGSHQVTYFAHLTSFLFIMLSLREALSGGKGWLIGVFLGCSFLSRQMTVYTTFFFATLLLLFNERATLKANVVNIFMLFGLFSAFVGVYLLYNYLRFDDPLETGYAFMEIDEMLQHKTGIYGNFHFAYLPFNFIYMFLQGPHIEFSGGLIPKTMDNFGTSLTFASPFLFAAIWAKERAWFLWISWAVIGLMILHILLYYNNGWVQINAQRFSLDFILILVFLVALSYKRVNKKVLKYAIVYSILMNIIGFSIFPVGKVIEWMLQ